jgi:hypothetical protein
MPPTIGAAMGFITSDPMPVVHRIGTRLARTAATVVSWGQALNGYPTQQNSLPGNSSEAQGNQAARYFRRHDFESHRPPQIAQVRPVVLAEGPPIAAPPLAAAMMTVMASVMAAPMAVMAAPMAVMAAPAPAGIAAPAPAAMAAPMAAVMTAPMTAVMTAPMTAVMAAPMTAVMAAPMTTVMAVMAVMAAPMAAVMVMAAVMAAVMTTAGKRNGRERQTRDNRGGKRKSS